MDSVKEVSSMALELFITQTACATKDNLRIICVTDMECLDSTKYKFSEVNGKMMSFQVRERLETFQSSTNRRLISITLHWSSGSATVGTLRATASKAKEHSICKVLRNFLGSSFAAVRVVREHFISNYILMIERTGRSRLEYGAIIN